MLKKEKIIVPICILIAHEENQTSCLLFPVPSGTSDFLFLFFLLIHFIFLAFELDNNFFFDFLFECIIFVLMCFFSSIKFILIKRPNLLFEKLNLIYSFGYFI